MGPGPGAAPPPSVGPPTIQAPGGQRSRIAAYVATHRLQTLGLVSVVVVAFFITVLLSAGGNGPPGEPRQPGVGITSDNEGEGTQLSTVAEGSAIAEPPLQSSCATVSVADVMENALPSVVQVLTNEGSGSGFIVNEDGLVVTNQHVIDGSRSVGIRLSSGRTIHEARVVEEHPNLDLAYIQMERIGSLTPIAVGDSDDLRQGEEVIAVGFPLGAELGEDATVTTGVISAKRQELDFLQTDASLNPGNSGGPLLNTYGYVVGVNTAGISETEDGRAVTGINFAIPINEVKNQLRSRIGSGSPACDPSATEVPIGERANKGSPPAQARIIDPTSAPTHTPVPTATPTLSPSPTNTPTPTIPPSPTPTVIPTATPSPTPTVIPTATPSPTPTVIPTATPSPTPTVIPTATPTTTPPPTPTRRSTQPPRPTDTPVPTPTATSTPRPTPTPTPLEYRNDNVGYSLEYPQGWRVEQETDGVVVITSGDDAAFIEILVEPLSGASSLGEFTEGYRLRQAQRAGNLDLYQEVRIAGEFRGATNYILQEFRRKETPSSCVESGVSHIYRSRFFPAREKGFIVTMSICEDSLRNYGSQREWVLSSFQEFLVDGS